MRVSILLTVFKRPLQLRISLSTLHQQKLGNLDYEIVVINDGQDDETESIVDEYTKKGLPVRYLFTGQRNNNGPIWRVPGFALNIAIKESSADIIVLTNADVFHLGNTISAVVSITENDPRALGTLKEVYDDNGTLIKYYKKNPITDKPQQIIDKIKAIPDHVRDKDPRADPRDPHFLAVRREHLLAIGGYDEDFTGYACEDTDLMDRLCNYGCYFAYTNTEVIHLHHGNKGDLRKNNLRAYNHNLKLLQSRQGQCIRNISREWGKQMADPIKSIVVCVDYDDFLSITLPQNKKHFSRTLIVTSEKDKATQQLAKEHGCECLITGAFYCDGANFNKGLAMEEGFDALGRNGWICVWDADIIMPENIEVSNRQNDCLYGPTRLILEDPATYNDKLDWSVLQSPTKPDQFSGYFQLFNGSFIPSPWYNTNSDHAGCCDSDFVHYRFPPEKRKRLPFDVLHLGPEGIPELSTRMGWNWCGRVTPRIDGKEIVSDCEQKIKEIKRLVHANPKKWS